MDIDALKEGVTPLMVACKNGHIKAARLLLERGARLDLKPGYGQQLMYDSCKSGHADIARLLTERGTKADPVDENGRTPLFTACLNGDLKAARVFLDLGAQINRRNKKGNTPLWKACHAGHVDGTGQTDPSRFCATSPCPVPLMFTNTSPFFGLFRSFRSFRSSFTLLRTTTF